MSSKYSSLDNRYARRLRIGVRFDDQKWTTLDGKDLTGFTRGAIGELVVDEIFLANDEVRSRLAKRNEKLLLKRETLVFFGLSVRQMGSNGSDLLHGKDMPLSEFGVYAAATLDEDLMLEIRGDERSVLRKCKVVSPHLQKPAFSLNHAFTLLSQRYETNRQSHTGNVFRRTFVRTEKGWVTLHDLRCKAIGELSADGDQSAAKRGTGQ